MRSQRTTHPPPLFRCKQRERIGPHGSKGTRAQRGQREARKVIASLVARNLGGVVYADEISLDFSCPILEINHAEIETGPIPTNPALYLISINFFSPFVRLLALFLAASIPSIPGRCIRPILTHTCTVFELEKRTNKKPKITRITFILYFRDEEGLSSSRDIERLDLATLR